MGWTNRMACVAIVTWIVVGCAGCGAGVTVRAEVERPARVPVRAFPRIVVVSGTNPESERVAQAVARHLATGRSHVELAGLRRIQALRATGRIERATVVVELAVRLRRDDRPDWSRAGQPECGALGCADGRRGHLRDLPLLRAQLSMRVSDGPSGRTLQRVELDDEESGIDEITLRMRLLERLSGRALTLVDQRTEPVVVELVAIDRGEVRGAIEEVRQGRWREGRRRLARYVRTDEFAALGPQERALVFYDLGQIARFDATMPAEARFTHAERALHRAVRLAPQPRFAQALAELDSHRESRDMVRVQQEAMAHNFAIFERRRGDVPMPPQSYR